jgi:Kazal-type serine protease inhibitor domain
MLHRAESASQRKTLHRIFIVTSLYFLAETRLQHIGACKRNQATNPCHQGSVYKPACASNGRTYASAQHVRCLKAANPALEVLHDGACTVQEVEKIVGLDDVCRMAMHRYEWNPICGADNVTYTNAYTFLCAAKQTPEDKSKTNIFQNILIMKVLVKIANLFRFFF